VELPRLRNVNIFPVQMSGEPYLCLQDPQNISEKALFLPPPVYFFVSFFDGEHSVLDIQAEYMRRFGEILFTEKIQQVIDQLEENFFLEGDRFQKALQEKEEVFKTTSIREAAFAGKSYLADAEPLRAQLKEYFLGPEGPGLPGEGKERDRLKGVVAPHIDFQRGGFCYAFAHRALKEESCSSCFVLLGTAHTSMNQPFCLTRKDFVIPLGKLETHRELVDDLQSRCSGDLFKDEGVHRSEHSIEFQCVFLRYLYPEPSPLKIVPILCGSFHEAIERQMSPMELKPVRQFIESLQTLVSSSGENICLVASADLAHVGHQFGDREGIREGNLTALAAEDEEMLGYVERMDGEGFFSFISRERDRRKICGLPAIYSLLKALEADKGRLLKYGQAFTPETQSVVTFASLAFYK
jgi:AmmeMemoRadiSam system protein B